MLKHPDKMNYNKCWGSFAFSFLTVWRGQRFSEGWKHRY